MCEFKMIKNDRTRTKSHIYSQRLEVDKSEEKKNPQQSLMCTFNMITLKIHDVEYFLTSAFINYSQLLHTSLIIRSVFECYEYRDMFLTTTKNRAHFMSALCSSIFIPNDLNCKSKIIIIEQIIIIKTNERASIFFSFRQSTIQQQSHHRFPSKPN